MGKKRLLILTSALLDDRKIVHGNLLAELNARFDVSIWATSISDNHTVWDSVKAMVMPLPEAVVAYFPQTVLRRINDSAWDQRFKLPSRKSISIHLSKRGWLGWLWVVCGWVCGWLRLHEYVENAVFSSFRSLAKDNPHIVDRLRSLEPDLVLVTGPNRSLEPPIAAIGQYLGIQVGALIHSMDNLTTKARMAVDYDLYLVWSTWMKTEHERLLPQAAAHRIVKVGAVHYQVFVDAKLKLSRDEFCANEGLDPTRPIVTYCLGSPNLFNEQPLLDELVTWFEKGFCRSAQLLVRPHPQFNSGMPPKECQSVHVRYQDYGYGNLHLSERTQSRGDVEQWVNTFVHSDVVINLSSSSTVDAAVCDTPIVNIDFDPTLTGERDVFVKEINRVWPHFSPIVRTGGLKLVSDLPSLRQAIEDYLMNPLLDQKGRLAIVDLICGDYTSSARLIAETLDVHLSHTLDSDSDPL